MDKRGVADQLFEDNYGETGKHVNIMDNSRECGNNIPCVRAESCEVCNNGAQTMGGLLNQLGVPWEIGHHERMRTNLTAPEDEIIRVRFFLRNHTHIFIVHELLYKW